MYRRAGRMVDNKVTIFIGTLIHCNIPYHVETIEKGFIIIQDSKIIAKDEIAKLKSSISTLDIHNYEEIKLKDTQLLIPGLIDTHIHAPQYPNVGLGYDMPLLEWLDKYTYNLEAKYSDLEFSKKVYDALVQKTLSYGTTTACYFASLFKESSLVLTESVLTYGQRAFIGKINMTRLSPDNYIETPEETISNTESFIQEVLSKKSDLVKPIITPRFALSVEMDVMKQLAELAAKYDCNIQTHISENCEEVKTVQNMFAGKDYAKVYDDANLLTTKTVLAHAVHLSNSEIQLIAARGTSISHCPTSNTRLSSGLCDVKKLISFGVTVGLGTDISGGHSPSIVEVMRSALDTSIHISYNNPKYTPMSYKDIFYFATLGGAKALALDEKIGNFEVGKEFDGLIVDMNVTNSSADLLESYNATELLQKFIYLGDDRNIIGVYIAGKKVK